MLLEILLDLRDTAVAPTFKALQTSHPWMRLHPHLCLKLRLRGLRGNCSKILSWKALRRLEIFQARSVFGFMLFKRRVSQTPPNILDNVKIRYLSLWEISPNSINNNNNNNNNWQVSYFVGDITKLEIDAIVNAANNSLLGHLFSFVPQWILMISNNHP